MSEPLLLAHDIGTSSAKTSLVTPEGTILDSESTPHATRHGTGGEAEQDPRDWWRGVVSNMRQILLRQEGAGSSAAEIGKRIAGIGVSGHMLCCLAVDAQGEPLRPCMIHSDTRATREATELDERVGLREVYRLTSNIADARSPLCKALWLKRNEPEVYSRTWRFLQSKDYIVGCLTGSFDSTDRSDASHAQWLDAARGAYAIDLFAALGLDAGKLPALHRGTDVVGRLSESAALVLGLPSGIPVVAGGGDGACATAGAGVAAAGDTYCCLGTTAWIASVSDAPVADHEARLFSIASLDGATWGTYGTVQSAGRSLEWVMELLGVKDFAEFDALLEAAPAGCDGLVFLPYLEGERSPIFDTNARGVFFGIAPGHRREHFARATVEGVSLALRSVLDVIRETREVAALRLIGGGGHSAFWRQMLADICGTPVQALSIRAGDATSLGAAMAAGVGVGIFRDLADAARRVSVEGTVAPNEALGALYERRFALYASLYPALRGAFAEARRSY